MAITKILTINDCGEKFAGKHLKQAVDYIIDAEKTQGGRYVTGINCQPQEAFRQMKMTKLKYGKTDKRQGYHLIISFEEKKLEPGLAFEIVGKFVEEFLGSGYEAIYAVHDNTDYTHGHIIFNSVNYLNGRKFRYERGDWAKIIQPITNRLCKKYGLSTIDIDMENVDKQSLSTEQVCTKDSANIDGLAASSGRSMTVGVGKQKRYQDWNEFRDGKFIWRDMIKRDLDACILQADNFDEFLRMMQEKGYEIKQNKYLAVKPMGMQRYCRCKSLGDAYTEEKIRQRIEMENLAVYASRPENDYVMNMPEDEFLLRTKLSGIQKTYYARVCRVRRLAKLPYSKAWQYRNEIRKMQRVYEQYLFLVKNDIHSLVELLAVKANLEEKDKECRRERMELNREKKRFEPLFEITGRMKELQAAENSFMAGDNFFLPEHNEYQECAEKLKQEGYTLEETETLKKRYKDRLAGNYERKQAVYQNLRLARGMETEIAETARNIQLEEKKQELEQKNNEKQEQPGR